MPRLTLVTTTPRSNTNIAAHRASATEGEAVKRLLESQGYAVKRIQNRQIETRCPFHEGPGSIERNKGTNFYVNVETGVYYCQSAACGERGNLKTLERHFGVDFGADEYVSAFKGREERLREFERNLTQSLRKPFYDQGLTDQTIERFRIGYEPEHEEEMDGGRKIKIPGRYVIPYLEGRRPKFFRYYDPNPATNHDGKYKYTWEAGAEGCLFNAQDAMGDANGIVFLAEGELKAMLLVQLGYAAVAVPGASMWKDEFQAQFTHARKILICFDNDNPLFHNYDKPEEGRKCPKCSTRQLDACIGHNPGQEAALKRVEQLGWRAKNILLPLSDERRKTDINEYFMRDGHSHADFAELATGKRATPYRVQTFGEITAAPPEEAAFLIDHGILPKGGRLLIAGKPKVGKSIFVDNLALSLAAGIPFLSNFDIKPGAGAHEKPTRVLLLDRELSKWSLFQRLTQLTNDRPGYRAAAENLMIDHDHLIRLDQKGSYDVLMQLVEQNGAEVIILDTAYKFFGGDVESSSSLMKAFEVLDKVIHETGCSVVMTHHHKKGQGGGGKVNTDIADPDNVAGSFLWTGWPNATILLNYLDRSVENPFNAIATFTAFRDAAPPEPLALYRSRESISYSAIRPYVHEDSDESGLHGRVKVTKPSTDLVAELLLEMCPTTEEDFLHVAAGKFGVSINTVRPYYIDAMSRGDFERTSGKPPIIKFKYDEQVDTWESEHGLPEKPIPDNAGVGLDDYTVPMFDAAELGAQ